MAPQDSFIDEDDDCCPLCVEEFDLSDKNFRPCPCGYQVCQFCFNNIKNNMNGLCPACRRSYDEKTIEWKVVSPEEIAQFKANIQKNAKKKAEQRQKEAQKREVESLNRKHLSGLRVVQKNLVYVVGLSPGIREEEILQTLRGDKYFGQYGKILKIVVSKAKQGEAGQNGSSLGVYVTFAKKDDAARCITAVNGSQNGDRVLRAQLGTTKYCSAYLRNEICTNKNCMFLHEPGDNDDSYSRQDLSSINSAHTQRPLESIASSSRSSRQTTKVQALIPQPQPVAASAQPMVRDNSKEGSDSGDGSALPSSASWAHRGMPQRSRRGSHATSGAASSPAISQAIPVAIEALEDPLEVAQESPERVNPTPASEFTTSTESSRVVRDPVLLNLLKAINSPAMSFSRSGINHEGDDSTSTFPPLFDDYGGERRRAMREQHQEEARLQLEQESQTDLRSVPEPLEEEEPESGSLQLGGEPEDRDIGREGSIPQGFQRRPSAQLPIQRGSNGGPFGPSLAPNFSQNLSNLSSINGRTLTPLQQQQLLLMKSAQPQSSFMEQFPPGMGNQISQGSALFQQQGHNKQSSRYNFANDSSSAASVKPSANLKLMAQQSSMMPPGSHTQQGNQFYGSSMPGPPPGLKSSGTPPINGMFGQGHSFGGSMGVSGFGGLAKENNDVLREVLRGRGTMGGSQSHDTGKREYFPSFLQQYPSASSTPAPGSGNQASLYGHQAGAFLDFGQKQKKKGKKHRHANTSSSGGGGLVDLADPSILQARMQHQQQSNAGVGQGLFGGQAQDDQDLPSLDEASFEVDALVADSFPDDLELSSFDGFGFSFVSRSSTPSVPPGFESLAHAHPPSTIREDAKTSSRMIATSAEFTPGRVRDSTPLAHVSLPASPAQTFSGPIQETPAAKAKQELKALATNSGLSRTIASQSSRASLQSEDFPALETGKGKGPATFSPTKSAKASPITTNKKAPIEPSCTAQNPNPTVKTAGKRNTPGILNIAMPHKSSTKTPTTPDALAKPVVVASEFPPLKSAAIQSPLTRNIPKTLRIASIPKPDAPNAGSATPSSVTSNFPLNLTTSRQPSLVSMSRFERPGTPTSDIVSDNASITSTSMSRASSPPPTRVGSAPVRQTTKSMQKKQRREIQKEKEKAVFEAAVAAKAEPETVEIAPIMGRKKKQKKEQVLNSATQGSTVAVSRAPSPHPESKASTLSVEQTSQVHEKQPVIEPEINRPSNKATESKGKGKAKGHPQQPSTPKPASTITKVEDEVVEKPIPSPFEIVHQLHSAGECPEPASLSILKNPSLNFKHQETPIDMQNGNQKLTITPEDRAALQSGLPVHKITKGPNRIMLTPNGDCVRNLTEEEEQRYLELQSRIAGEFAPAAFLSEKYHAGNGFILIGGRAVPNGPPAFFPTLNGNAQTLDPVAKIQRDEALSYINQYVLPSLSTNSQLEKALNANALDTEMLHESAWPQNWSNESTAPHAGNGESTYGGVTTHDGILATGLETMTAHFAVGRDIDRGQPLGNVGLLSLTEAESAMQVARKETEGLEKKLNALLKKNRRLLLGSSH